MNLVKQWTDVLLFCTLEQQAAIYKCQLALAASFNLKLNPFGHKANFEHVQVFGGLNLKAGDRILTSVSEYGSNFLAYLQVIIIW